MDPITIGMSLLKFAPTIAGWIFKDDKEDMQNKVTKVVEIAKTVTGIKDNDEKMIEALEKDKATALKFQEAIHAMQIELLKEENKRLQIVNTTMQAEAKSDHFIQYSWRPFNGYLFGITIFCVFVLIPIFKPDLAIKIPEFVFVMWGAVLGVTAWHRGIEKREVKTGAQRNNLGNVVSRTLR